MERQRNVVGQVYRCLVCGAEVTVINNAPGELAPVCCNEPMSLLPQRHRAFHCPVCGAQIVVIRRGPGALAPVCCNRPMDAIQPAA